MCVCMAVHVAYLATGPIMRLVCRYCHAIVARARSVCPCLACVFMWVSVAGREIADSALFSNNGKVCASSRCALYDLNRTPCMRMRAAVSASRASVHCDSGPRAWGPGERARCVFHRQSFHFDTRGHRTVHSSNRSLGLLPLGLGFLCDDPAAAAAAPASRVDHSRNTVGQDSLRLGPYPHRVAATQQRHLGRHEATMEVGGPWE